MHGGDGGGARAYYERNALLGGILFWLRRLA